MKKRIKAVEWWHSKLQGIYILNWLIHCPRCGHTSTINAKPDKLRLSTQLHCEICSSWFKLLWKTNIAWIKNDYINRKGKKQKRYQNKYKWVRLTRDNLYTELI